jgi:hypothetical protein
MAYAQTGYVVTASPYRAGKWLIAVRFALIDPCLQRVSAPRSGWRVARFVSTCASTRLVRHSNGSHAGARTVSRAHDRGARCLERSKEAGEIQSTSIEDGPERRVVNELGYGMADLIEALLRDRGYLRYRHGQLTGQPLEKAAVELDPMTGGGWPPTCLLP